MLPEIDAQYLLDFLTALLNIPSPTGFAQAAIASLEESLGVYPAAAPLAHTQRGAVSFLAGERVRCAACPYCPRRYAGGNGQGN